MGDTTIKGINVKFGADTIEFDKSVNGVNNALKLVTTNVKKLSQQMKLDPSSVELMQKKYDALGQQMDLIKKKIEYQTQELKSFADEDVGTTKWTTLANQIEANELKLTSLNKQMESLKEHMQTIKFENMQKLGDSISSVGSKIENVGEKLTVISAAAGAGIGASLKSIIEFEDAFTGVEKTVNATSQQLFELKNRIIDMSEEIPASTTEISAVAEAAGQLGIATDNIVDFTRTMIDLGNATNLTSDEAATSLARFANITGMSQTEFDKLGSTIVALGNNFATTEAEIVSMAMRLAGAGAQVGMSESDILALATALSSVGIEAEAGGSAISKVLVNMQLAVETASDSLQDFANVAGLSAEEFAEKFKTDATDALNAFIVGLANADQTGTSAIKMLNDMEIKEVRMRDALLRSAGASDLLTNAVELGSKSWKENAALTNETEKRYNTLSSQLEITKNKLTTVLNEFGQRFAPVLKKGNEKLQQVIDSFWELSDQQITVIAAIAAIVTALGPAVLIFGKVTTAIGGAITAIGSLGASGGALSSIATVLTGPVGAAIALLVSSFALAYSSSEQFKQSINSFVTTIGESVAPILTQLANIIGTLLTDSFRTLKSISIPVWDSISKILNEVFLPIIQEVFTYISEHVLPIFETLATFFTTSLLPAIQLIINVFTWLIDNILTPLVTLLVNNVIPILIEVASVFTDIFGNSIEFVTSLVSLLIDIIRKLVEGIGILWEKFKNTEAFGYFQEALEAIKWTIDTVSSAIESLIGWIGSLVNSISSGLSGALGWLSDKVSGIFSSGGFGLDPQILASGGIGIRNLSLNTTINVNNQGKQIGHDDVNSWATQMADVISYEIARRL